MRRRVMRTLLYGPQPSSATPASAGLSPASGKNCRPRDKACRWSLPAILCKPLNQLDFVIATRWPAGCRRQAGPSRFQGFASVEYVEYCARFTCCGFAHLAVANAGIFIHPGHRLAAVRGLARCRHVGAAGPAACAGKPSRSGAHSTHLPFPATGAATVNADERRDRRFRDFRYRVQSNLRRPKSGKLTHSRQ